MYPAEYFSLFPPFPRKNEVFVAMSFSKQFAARWNDIIRPAIEQLSAGETKLKAHRVDSRTVSDCILTEILTGISQCRVFMADVTTIGLLDKSPIRNANVFYEVGIAHAMRLPEEVVLFRSDNEPLLFDVANIRVNTYDPDGNPENAKRAVADAISSALKEVNLKKHLTVQRTAETLDYPSWWSLMVAHAEGKVSHPVQKTMGQILGAFSQAGAIAHLLEIGALKTRYQQITPEILEEKSQSDNPAILMQYECTALGAAICDFAIDKLGIFQPDIARYFENMPKPDGQA